MPRRAMDTLFVALLASTVAGALFLVRARHGFDLADEGFLWYGVQAVLRGEVPLRDFEAYDPGRYYWCALWALLLGDGLVALRAATAAFQALALTFGLLAVRRFIHGRMELALAGVVLGLSMPLHYKYFESGLTLVAVFVALRLLEDPSSRRWVWAGTLTGLAACFGRNVGLYDALALLALLTFQSLSRGASFGWSRLGAWAAGVVAGYSPILFMATLVPGFASAFVDSVLLHFELGATNLALPVPWPWRLDWQQPWTLRFGSDVAVSALFAAIPAYVAWLVWRLGSRDHRSSVPTWTRAASLVGVAHLHYAFSRADAAHLSFVITPLLVGVMGWPERPRVRRGFVAALALLMLLSMGVASNLPAAALPSRRAALVRYPVGGNVLWVEPGTAFLIQQCGRVVRERLRPGESVMFVPYLPGMYAALRVRSPVWGIYADSSASERRQREMIRQLRMNRGVWVMVFLPPIDGRKELGFRNTHSLVWDHIRRSYRPVRIPPFPPYILWFRLKE